MAHINSILDERMKKPSNMAKMSAMAKQSAEGHLTTFSGLFSIAELSEKEKESIEALLNNYAQEDNDIQKDLQALLSLTSEVKAINNQAALLHGERIKKAHDILISYRDGAFTAWLMAAYGNRQTPYNLMQYYEFCEAMPKQLRPQIEAMPRQAIYVLASREGNLKQKQTIVENYKGETKSEMLSLIRQLFPLNQQDKRRQKVGKAILQNLERVFFSLEESSEDISPREKKEILTLLKKLQMKLEKP